MEVEEIYQRITPVFHDLFDSDDLVLSPQLTADDIEEWDSLNHVRLVVTIEEVLNIRFSTAEIAKFETVGDLVDVILSKLST